MSNLLQSSPSGLAWPTNNFDRRNIGRRLLRLSMQRFQRSDAQFVCPAEKDAQRLIMNRSDRKPCWTTPLKGDAWPERQKEPGICKSLRSQTRCLWSSSIEAHRACCDHDRISSLFKQRIKSAVLQLQLSRTPDWLQTGEAKPKLDRSSSLKRVLQLTSDHNPALLLCSS
jgi:hypothetical protein